MLGKYGETLVVDWGLAKVIGRAEGGAGDRRRGDAAAGLGRAARDRQSPGTAIGTPAFMSPEQAEGQLDRLGPASDIYGLGATLYCLSPAGPLDEERDIDEMSRTRAKR